MKRHGERKLHDLRIGFHTSIAGGISRSVERAVDLDCNTMQIFSHNPRQWAKSVISDAEAGRFITLRTKYDINPVYVHTSYLINLAAKSGAILKKSIEFLSYELANADQLHIEYVVLHTGSASAADETKARRTAAKSLLRAVCNNGFNAKILLENTAGQRGDITSSVQSLAEIIDMCHCEGIGGVCIDTCHAFSAGYNLSSEEGISKLRRDIEVHVGIENLKLIHLNDSKRPYGSGVDRHEHIGKGFIGKRGFSHFLADKVFRSVPLILETPKQSDNDDRRNLRTVYDILQNVPS